jgi:hypothetical protein
LTKADKACYVHRVISTLDTLKRTLEIIQERGWSPLWSQGPTTPLNIRSAVSYACSELFGEEQVALRYRAYRDATDILSKHLEAGIIAWEFGPPSSKVRRRKQSEVEAMLTEVIARLEKENAVQTQGSDPRRAGGSGGAA